MSTYTDVTKWADDFEKRMERLPKTLTVAFRVMALEYQRDYYRALTGTVSTAQLRAMGHPYAREGKGRMRGASKSSRKKLGIKRIQRDRINKQTGKLVNSLSIKPKVVPGNLSTLDIGTDTEYTKYILHPLGTRKMVGRGILTGHALGLKTPGLLERAYRAKEGRRRQMFRVRAS